MACKDAHTFPEPARFSSYPPPSVSFQHKTSATGVLETQSTALRRSNLVGGFSSRRQRPSSVANSAVTSMTSQKRSAPDASPQYRPSKHQRTTLDRSDTGPGVRASPSQHEGLGTRWLSLLKDTLSSMFGLDTNIDALPTFNFDTPPPPRMSEIVKNSKPPPDLPPPPRRLPPKSLDPLSIPSNLGASTSKTLLPNRSYASSSSFTSSANPSLTMGSTSTPRSSMYLSRMSSISNVYSSCTSPSQYDELQLRLNKVRLGSFSAHGGGGVKKAYKPRKHILDSQHKQNVSKALEEAYQEQKKLGYKSDMSTFRGFMDYKKQMEAAGLSTQKSQRNIISKLKGPDDDLSRARTRAARSLLSPRPPAPFCPTFDELERLNRQKDKDIEDKLRKPSRPPLPERLPEDASKEVERLIRIQGTVSTSGRASVVTADIQRLRKSNMWLNDEVINFYGELMMKRASEAASAKENAKTLPSIHYFSTFFWQKLDSSGYEKGNLKKWTKKVDIFSKDILLFPINHSQTHWTSAAINFKKKRIESYDSMGMDRSKVFKKLREYLDAEHKTKKSKPFDFSGWIDYEMEDYPQQENGYDCGVFVCATLDTIARGFEDFNFTQQNMSYIRARMIWEIGRAKLGEQQ